MQPEEVGCIAWLSPSEFKAEPDTVIQQLTCETDGTLKAASETVEEIKQHMTRSVLFVYHLLVKSQDHKL